MRRGERGAKETLCEVDERPFDGQQAIELDYGVGDED